MSPQQAEDTPFCLGNQEKTGHSARGGITVTVGVMFHLETYLAVRQGEAPAGSACNERFPCSGATQACEVARSVGSPILHLIATQGAVGAILAEMPGRQTFRVGQASARLRDSWANATGTPQRPPDVQGTRRGALPSKGASARANCSQTAISRTG